jgi:hypothetical protein
MSTASIEVHFSDAVLEDVFEGGLEGMDGGIDLGGCFELQSLVSSSEFDPYRSKVAEEMLLCESSFDEDMLKH